MSQPFRLKFEDNGLIAVEQGTIGSLDISFNPDDERFYVHLRDPDRTTVATFKEKRNAVQWARRKERA